MAAACAIAGLGLAAHHPLSPAAAAVAFAAVAIGAWRSSAAWLAAVPALLPLLGLAPWSGWLVFEETDLLALAVATGAYARLACTPARGGDRLALLVGLVGAAFLVSTVVSMIRGFDDAGGFAFGWYQGLHEPLNSLRLGKAFVLACLLLPPWLDAARRAPQRVGAGLAAGLAVAALGAVWERWAFTDLLNFSSDYRTTSLFWEMHVGGAAFDGFLALTLPFAVRELLVARQPLHWAAAAAATLLGAYACLTTFSRGVFAAVPVGLLILALLVHRQAGATTRREGTGAIRPALPWLAGFVAAALWAFPTSGYRGLLAAFGACALALPLSAHLRGARAATLLRGMAGGLTLAALAWAASSSLDKGAYIAYAVAVALAAGLIGRGWLGAGPQPGARRQAGALAAYFAALGALVLVADHWGGESAQERAWPVALALLAAPLAASRSRRPAFPEGWRWRGGVLGAMAIAGATVAVFDGGAYMGERFATGRSDLEGRFAHWREGLSWLDGEGDWLAGKGLGRYPAQFALRHADEGRPGDYRLRTEGTNGYLVLTGGRHVIGWGELFRFSQRIDLPRGRARVRMDVRTAQRVPIHVEVCEKHLLYEGTCAVAQAVVEARPGVWQPLSVELPRVPLSRGDWFAPRLIVFSMALGDRAVVADIDNVSLVDESGHGNLLANGDFQRETARWFFSSDRNHLPWHIKNVFLHVLFEQGAPGLVLWLALVGGALWRVTLGHARTHALAPPLAAALAGFLVVGLFDSLLDVPRVAFLFYALVLLALTLRTPLRGGMAQATGATGTRAASLAAALLALALAPRPARADEATLHVGPQRALATLAAAAAQAGDGAVVEVDAGTYRADVAVWTQRRLTLRAVGGRVHLVADGAAAEGKAIWVVRGGTISVEGFDFEGARVPDRNGAGIRLETGTLRVRDCGFFGNETGLLTNNDPATVLEVEGSEFARNGRADGANHQLYAGRIARLEVRASHFHDGRLGHLLKSRAAVSVVAHNRISDEDGDASYEVEFPNGGEARVVGNLIQQSARSANAALVSYGAEGLTHAHNTLHLVHNTLVSDLAGPHALLRVHHEARVEVQARANLVVGEGRIDPQLAAAADNPLAARADFADAAHFDFRLRRDSPLARQATVSGIEPATELREYSHPRRSLAVQTAAPLPGAFQRPVDLR